MVERPENMNPPTLEEGLEEGRFRIPMGATGWVIRILGIAVPIYAALYVLHVIDYIFAKFGWFLYSGVYSAVFLAAVFVMVFLAVPAGKSASSKRVPWYDFLLAAAGAGACVYVAVVYEDVIVTGAVTVTVAQQLMGLVAVAVLLEALRRTLGWSMVIIALFFLIHAKFTYLFPGMLHGPEYSLGRVMSYVYLSNQGIFGMILEIATTVVVAFITFGCFLEVSRGSDLFLKLSTALLGHVRGGGAKVAVMGSALLGTMTGSPIANVGIVGSFTIPLMKRIGYSPVFAGAVETAASTGGVIMPPVMGVVAFIMADLTEIPYGKIALAATVPAVLYFLALYFQIDLYAARKGLVGVPKAELPSLKEALRENFIFLPPLVLLAVLMMWLQFEETTAVYYSMGLLIAIAALDRKNRLTLGKVIMALEKAGLNMITLVPLMAAAGIIIASVSITGLGVNLSNILLEVSGGSLILLTILTGLACYVMGMGVSAVATYIILATLVAPAMIQKGIPILVAHFFIFYMGASLFITPPLAPAAFAASVIAKASPFAIGFQAMRLAIVAYLVPVTIIFNPALLLIGSGMEILTAIVTALIAVYALSVGIEGWFRCQLHWAERVIWLASGLLLFVPVVSMIAPGLVLLAAGIAIQLQKSRSRSRAPAPDPTNKAFDN